ncbi:MAG: tetratricopeptide repeat protein [Acidobacteriota bacterium]
MRRFTTFAAVLLTGTLLAGTPVFAQKQMKPKSKKEGDAIQAMLSAQDPDSRIKAADELITKFADTEFKPYALYLEADSYLQKGDNDKAIFFAEQTLEADPKNYQAAILLAKTYAGTTHVNDLDKEEKLTKAAKYAIQAQDALKTAEKPNASLTDAQWTEIKNDFTGQSYYALGIVAAYHNKMDEVAADFQKVAELDTDPTDLIRAGRALLDVKKYAEAVTWFDKALAAPNANDQIKDIATKDKARAQAMIKK